MEEEIKIFVEQLENTWILFLHKIPAIILALLVLAIGGFVIKLTSKYARKTIHEIDCAIVIMRKR